jgi:TolB-like protein
MTPPRWRRAIGVALAGTMLATAPSALLGQTPVASVAVLPLENAGSYGRDRENFDALRKGLAAILATDLAASTGLRIAGRAEVLRALDQAAAGTDRIDRETAVRVGKLLGVRLLVTGSFIDLYGDFRIDARLLNVETGEFIKVVRSDPVLHDRSDMYRMVQSVVRGLSGPPLPQAPAAPPARSIPAEALSLYSLGLLHLDRGDSTGAQEFFRKALAGYSDFMEAREAIRP